MISVAINALGIGSEPVGTGQYACHLINALAKLDHVNKYVILKSKASTLPVQDNENISYLDVGFRNRLHRVLLENITLPRIIKRCSSDLFHSPIFTIPPFLNVPCVVTIHDLVFCKFPQTIGKLRRPYLRSAIRYSIANSDRIIAISQSTKTDLLDIFNVQEEKIDVIYLAAAPCFRRTENKSSSRRVCKRYSIDQPFMLYVGTLEPRKNVPGLIRAYHTLRKEYGLNYKLVIAGRKGWNYKEIFAEVKRLALDQDVIFTGYVPNEDLAHIYNGAELFVLPSLYEGFGLPILEAMACGTPVITSNVSSMPEVAGDAALLVDPYNVEEIAEAMHRLLADRELREDLVQRGLERVKHFSWERCARETLEVYKKAVSNE